MHLEKILTVAISLGLEREDATDEGTIGRKKYDREIRLATRDGANEPEMMEKEVEVRAKEAE